MYWTFFIFLQPYFDVFLAEVFILIGFLFSDWEGAFQNFLNVQIIFRFW